MATKKPVSKPIEAPIKTPKQAHVPMDKSAVDDLKSKLLSTFKAK